MALLFGPLTAKNLYGENRVRYHYNPAIVDEGGKDQVEVAFGESWLCG